MPNRYHPSSESIGTDGNGAQTEYIKCTDRIYKENNNIL